MYTIARKRDISAELIEGLKELKSERAAKLDIQG